MFSNLKRSYKSLPDKKQYIEFFTALLTVPMLLTVITLNLNNLRGNNKPPEEPVKESRPIIVNAPSITQKETPSPSQEPCKKEIGPITIAYPDENEVVIENPVIIDIDYTKDNYCAVVWSYRINNGRYSDYDDKSIALYNPPKGTIRFDLRVKSLITGETKTLTRVFSYQGATIADPDQPSASQSAQ